MLNTRVRMADNRLSRVPALAAFAMLAIAAGAIATLPLLLSLAVIAACAAAVSAIWLEAGYVCYVTGLYFILFIKRIALNQPVGLALDGFVAVLLLAALLRFSRASSSERWRWHHPIVAAVLAYKAYQVVDAFNPTSLGWVFSIYAVRQTLPSLSVFLLTVLLLGSRRRLTHFMVFWFALAAAVGLYAIKQQFFGFYWREWLWMYSPEGQAWTTGDGVLRVFSFMLPDTTGITMAYGITIGLALLFAPLRGAVKALLIVLLPIFAAAMLYTGTRGAYGAALVGVAVVVLVMGRWWLYLVSPLVATMAALLIDWKTNYWGARFLSLFDPQQDASYQVRQDIIHQYLGEALNRPFGGGTATTSYAGFAQEQFQAAQASGATLANGIQVPTDNNYFLAVLELGVVGELLLLALVGVCLFYGVRLVFRVRDRSLRCLGIGLCGCCVAATVASIANNYLDFWGTWIILGLICSVDQLSRTPKAAQVGVALHVVPAPPSVLRRTVTKGRAGPLPSPVRHRRPPPLVSAVEQLFARAHARHLALVAAFKLEVRQATMADDAFDAGTSRESESADEPTEAARN